MNEPKTCSQCGVEIPADSKESVCPQCLMKLGFESQLSESADPDRPTSLQSEPEMVDPKRLLSLFPELDIHGEVGRGGMGVVYRATQKHLDRPVALKLLRPDIAGDPSFAERFSREARALARLNHSAILALYDFGQREELYYFLMEFVDGTNLRDVVRSAKLTPSEALAIVPTICDALQYAHDEGVVHRDIKPENILIDAKGRVKIADFGLAKLIHPTDDEYTLTGTQQVMGTPQYMAPEQLERPHNVDHRADIYSLGVVIYELLTGELPLGRTPKKRRGISPGLAASVAV